MMPHYHCMSSHRKRAWLINISHCVGECGAVVCTSCSQHRESRFRPCVVRLDHRPAAKWAAAFQTCRVPKWPRLSVCVKWTVIIWLSMIKYVWEYIPLKKISSEIIRILTLYNIVFGPRHELNMIHIPKKCISIKLSKNNWDTANPGVR